tara:strand:- start:9786 stop:10862 length:1077 start_codon:yes stop_codon:yes gene_type:complete
MEEIVVKGTRETGPDSGIGFRSSGRESGFNTDDAFLLQYAHLLPGNSLKNTSPIDIDGQLNPLDLENMNPEASYRGQGMDNFLQGTKQFGKNVINTGKEVGKNLYDTAAMTSKGIANIPIAGLAYQNAIKNANPGAFLAGQVIAPTFMSDFGFAEGGDVRFRTPEGGDLRDMDGTSLNNFQNSEYEVMINKIMQSTGVSRDQAVRMAEEEIGRMQQSQAQPQPQDEMNYKANGGQVRRRVPDVYFNRYNMGGAVVPGQQGIAQAQPRPPVNKNPMMQNITNTDPRYYSPPPNPMGNLAGGISNLANNQKKTNKILGGNNQNNNAMNQNLKISYNPNPTNMEQRRVFSNVLESTRPVMA